MKKNLSTGKPEIITTPSAAIEVPPDPSDLPPTNLPPTALLLTGGEDKERRERVGKATFAITALHMTGRLAGFVEGMLVSHLAGGGGTAGAYFAASKIPQGIFGFGESLLTHSFLPPFVDMREKQGEGSAWRLASLVATIQFIILVALVILGEIFAPQIVKLYASKFDVQEFSTTVSLVRVMLPGVVMMSMASLSYVILNAYKQFALPAFGDTALKIGIVTFGAGLFFKFGIKGFAIGLVAGAFAKLAVHLLGLQNKLRLLSWNLNMATPGSSKLLALMLPLMIGNILSSVRPLLDTHFCGAAKEVAALNFAFKLTNLPFFLVPYALSIALFPFLAEMASRGDHQQIGRALVSALRMVVFLLVPVMAVYLVLTLPMVEAVYKGGQFTAADANRVLPPLVWYTVGMIPLAIETVVLQIFFALSDTTTPTVIAYSTFVVYLAAAWGSTKMGWGAAGVAMAVTISKLVKDVILLIVLTPRLQGLDLRGTGRFAARLTAATLAMIVVLWGCSRVVKGHVDPTPDAPAAAPASVPTTTPAGPTTSPAGPGTSPAGPGTSPAGPGTSPAGPGTSPGVPTATVNGTNSEGIMNPPPISTAAAGQATGPAHKPGKKKGGVMGTLLKLIKFCVLAAPGLIIFAIVAYWLRIEEMNTLYGVLVRRLGPLLRKVARAAMARW